MGEKGHEAWLADKGVARHCLPSVHTQGSLMPVHKHLNLAGRGGRSWWRRGCAALRDSGTFSQLFFFWWPTDRPFETRSSCPDQGGLPHPAWCRAATACMCVAGAGAMAGP